MSQLSLFEENTLEGKIKRSIEVIRLASKMSEEYYNKPIMVAYSGGKDSDVLLDLVKRAGVPFEIYHSLTTVDAPPTVQHVKKVFKELNAQGTPATIRYPEYKGQNITMWRLIEKKQVPPTRIARYCCKVLKESASPNRLVVLGVRAAESAKRSNRKEFELRGKTLKDLIGYGLEHVAENYDISHDYGEAFDCTIIANAKDNNEIICNPIIPWLDADIWEYIDRYGVEINELYSMGFNRVGCVGCPLGGGAHMENSFSMFPKYKQNYIKAFDRMLKARAESGKTSPGWETPEKVFEWWLNKNKEEPQIDGQEELEGF